MTDTQCALCGHKYNLRYLAGHLYCKRCYNSLPRGRCKAQRRDGQRCAKWTVLTDLCAEHTRNGAQPLSWVRCSDCGHEYVEGTPHNCSGYPREKIEAAKELARQLRAALADLPPKHADYLRHMLTEDGRCVVCGTERE